MGRWGNLPINLLEERATIFTGEYNGQVAQIVL